MARAGGSPAKPRRPRCPGWSSPPTGRGDGRSCGAAGPVRGPAPGRWRAGEPLRHNALHDPLTGLPNRTLFLDRLGHVLASRTPRGAVMFLDIDNFKLINDSLGHDA